MQAKDFQRNKWLKLALFVNMIILVKATIIGISRISTHIFVNIICINMKHIISGSVFKMAIIMTGLLTGLGTNTI